MMVVFETLTFVTYLWLTWYDGQYTSRGPSGNHATPAANPSYQRGRVHRTHISHGDDCGPRRARHPAPDTANDHPTAIVEWSKAPGRVVDPSPSPRGNPNPVAVAIRSPAHNNGVREPHVAVFRHGAPATVFVEIFVTDYVIRNVAHGSRMLFPAVAVVAPVIEIVLITETALNVGVQLVEPIEIAFF